MEKETTRNMKPNYEVSINERKYHFFTLAGARAWAVQMLPGTVSIYDLNTGQYLHSEEPAQTIARAFRSSSYARQQRAEKVMACGYGKREAAAITKPLPPQNKNKTK